MHLTGRRWRSWEQSIPGDRKEYMCMYLKITNIVLEMETSSP
jgi:hypothetical protein